VTSNVVPLAKRSSVAGAVVRLRAARAVYTVREVADLLSLSLGSTYALLRSGAIPARKLGGRWVIPKQRFHTWLNSATDDDLCLAGTGRGA
jgi:excisionase family DNA binding protein